MELRQAWGRIAESLRDGGLAPFREFFWPRDASKTYLLCAVIAVTVPWVHEYPVGIDLPHHVNMFQVLAHYRDPSTAYRIFYRLDFFTPYALVYVLGWLFAKALGAMFAVKMILSLCILTLPATMTRWLRLIGGEPSLGLAGFALVFGYGYVWGFVSFVLAGSLSFAYLGELSRLLAEPSWKRRLVCAGLAVLLFFCHGIAFGFTMLAGGLSCLLRRSRLKVLAADLLHYVPALLVVIPWQLRNQRFTSAPFNEPPTVERFSSLFSGAVATEPGFFATVCAFAAAATFFAVTRPRLSYRPIRLLPLALGLFGLFTVPETVSETFLVGTRFVQFVWFFGLGAFDFPVEVTPVRRLRAVTTGLVLTAVLAFHYRMYVFNTELAGLDELREHIPAGSDLRLVMGNSGSDAFGSIAHRNVGAYIPALQGGFLAGDSSSFFQIPVRRRGSAPMPAEFEYVLTRGSKKEARREVGKQADHLVTVGRFQLFRSRRTKLEITGLKFVRFGQDWEVPRQDLSVEGKPLRVGGNQYQRGLGVHANSILQFAPAPGMRRLCGRVGMDDESPGAAPIVFRIRDFSRRVLFESKPMHVGDPPEAFDISIEGLSGDVFFLVDASSADVTGTHADWLELEARP